MTAAALGGLLDLIADNTINGRIAKDVFEAMVETGKDAAAIVDEKGLRQVTDTGAIDEAVDRILAANPDKVAEYQIGQGQAVRVLRWPDHEGDGREGQSGADQRNFEAKARGQEGVGQPFGIEHVQADWKRA